MSNTVCGMVFIEEKSLEHRVLEQLTCLRQIGVSDVLLIGEDFRLVQYMQQLSSGHRCGVRLTYQCNEGYTGLRLLALAEDFAAGRDLVALAAGSEHVLDAVFPAYRDYCRSESVAEVVLRKHNAEVGSTVAVGSAAKIEHFQIMPPGKRPAKYLDTGKVLILGPDAWDNINHLISKNSFETPSFYNHLLAVGELGTYVAKSK